jgi:benzoylformate decarboxylase
VDQDGITVILIKNQQNANLVVRRAQNGLTKMSKTPVANRYSPADPKAVAEDWKSKVQVTPRTSEPSTAFSGAEAVLRTAESAGVRHVFGLPGTSVAKFLDELTMHPNLPYILGKHEGPTVAMADGYAKITGRTAFVNLYMVGGTMNSLAMLYDSHKTRTPLVVTVGQQEQNLQHGSETVMEGDVIPLVQQVTRYAVEVSSVERLAGDVARAFKFASAPPMPGPTLVSIPMNLMDETAPTEIPDVNKHLVSTRMVGDLTQFERAVDLLLRAERPLIVSGGQVTRHDGIDELVEVAELLGIPVAFENHFNDRISFPPWHACSIGDLNPSHPHVSGADVVFAVGCRLHHELHRAHTPLLPPSAKVIQMNLEPRALGLRLPVDAAIIADPKSGLRLFADMLQRRMTVGGTSVAAARLQKLRLEHVLVRKLVAEQASAGLNARPINPWQVVCTIDEVAGPDAIIVSELSTSQRTMARFYGFRKPENFYADTGCALGWGLGAAAGMKIGRPDATVVCCVGDGAFLFGMQALWTIANYRIPTVTVVFNNGGYFSTRSYTESIGGRTTLSADNYVGGDMPNDPTNIAKIAAGFGIWSRRVENGADLRPVLLEALSLGEPAVVEVMISRYKITPGQTPVAK